MDRTLMMVMMATLAVACEGQVVCDLCGGDHETEDHLASAMTGAGGIENPQMMTRDDLLLLFVTNRRAEGFVRVNESAYPSAVSDQNINVFVSNFALPEYLETRPDAETSDGMLPRGGFVVREIVGPDGEVSKLTALYRGPVGYNPTGGDFWFAVTDPDGNVLADAHGQGLVGPVSDCSLCHANRAEADFLFGVPTDVRVPNFDWAAPSTAESEAVEAEPSPVTPDAPVTTEPPAAAPPIEQPPAVPLTPEMVDLRGFVLANVQPENSREQSTTLDLEVEVGATIIIARDADRATFEQYWGPLGADVVFVNQGGTSSFGAPIVNGGEVWELRDASGAVQDGPTPPGAVSMDYSRISPMDWRSGYDTAASPGVVDAMLPPGVWITEWSDATDYRMEFVELALR